MTEAAERTATSVRAIVIVVMCGALVGPLNSTMIAVALPQMAVSLQVGTGTMSWLVTAYLIAMASLQPVAGKLSDRLGRRPMLLGGYALFGVVSLIAALVPHLGVLIVCRVLQAVAAALLMPSGMALLREVVPEERLGRVLGLFGAVMPLAAAVGPVVGGVLVQGFGWQGIFWVNLPLSAVSLMLGWWVIPRTPGRARPGRFDLVGAFWLSALLIAGTALLDRSPTGLVLIGCAVALALALVGFVLFELRRRDPVLSPRLFTRPVFAASAGGIALANLAFYVVLLAVPILLHGRAVSEAAIGLVLGALTIASSPMALLGGRLADRVGMRIPAVGGLVLVVIGLLPLAFGATSLLPLVLCLAVTGAGVGLSMTPLQLGAVRGVDAADTGASVGVFFTSRYLGSVIGSSLLAGVLAPDRVGFGTLFTVLAVVAAAATLVVTRLPGRTAEAAST